MIYLPSTLSPFSKSLILAFVVTVFFCTSMSFAQDGDDGEFTSEGYENTVEKDPDGDAVKLFIEAQTAHEKGDLETALRLYNEAIKANPRFSEAHYQRGAILESRKLYVEAEDAFRSAVEFRPDWTLGLARFGSILVKNKKYFEAESTLERTIRIDTMSFPAYVSLADLYLLRPPGDSKIKNLYSRLVYLPTKSKVPASIWAARAAVERLQGKLVDAKESISRAFALEKNNKLAKFEEIELTIAGLDLDAAIAMSRALIGQYPLDPGPKILLARSLALSGKADEGIGVLESIEPKSKNISDLIAGLKKTGDIDFAELEMAVSRNPKDVTVLGQLCNALRRREPLKALEYCRRAYELERNNIGHAIGYAAAQVQLRQFLQAIRLLSELKARYPDNYTVRANLAISYFQLSQFTNAKVEYLWITKKRPELPAGFYFLAITHDNLKEYMDAMANYQQFLRIAGDGFQLEKERIGLRLPVLQRLIKRSKE
jgi:tetratricopeptide (TPR) repeat protein